MTYTRATGALALGPELLRLRPTLRLNLDVIDTSEDMMEQEPGLGGAGGDGVTGCAIVRALVAAASEPGTGSLVGEVGENSGTMQAVIAVGDCRR